MKLTLDHRPDSRKTSAARAAGSRYMARPRSWPGRRLALVLLAGAAAACAPRASTSRARPAAVDARTWAAQMLGRLSLEQKVAQLLVPALPSGLANAHSPELRNAQRLARELGVGGFLVAPGAPLETAAALNSLQQAAELPLLLGADYDGLVGGVLRDPDPARTGSGAEGGTLFPGNMGLAATGQPLHAELAGRVAAREARAVGVRWLLGPVAGITRIGETATEPGAFSDDAATVVRFAGAAVRGMASAQVLTTVRAFPARTTARGAAAMPVLAGSLAALEAGEVAVLRELLRLGGVDALMLGNARVPALTGDSLTPLTLSRAVATELLRKRLGFGGLIVTDRLDDPALRAVPGYGAGEVAVRALEAGADVLLAPPDAGVAQRAIIAAVRSGRLPYNRIDDSVRRLLIAKALTGLAEDRSASLDSVFTVVAAPEHAIVAAEVAAQSLVLVRDSASLLPLDPRHVRSLALVAVAAPSAVGAGAALAAELRTTYGSATTFERIDERTADAVIDAAVARAGVAQAVVLAVFEPDQPWSERGRVSRFAARIAQRLEAVNHRLVVVAFGDPVPAASLPADALLLAWQPRGAAAQIAAARALSGRSPIGGVLPIAIPEGRALRRPAADVQLRPARAPEVGMDALALERIDGLLLSAIHQGASPGAAIAVGRHGRIVKLRGYGRIDYRQSYADVTDSTIYDLASLTKVIGTTSALGMLVERGVLDLDAPVGHYIPEWNTTPAKASVTLRDLALHTSGLAAYGPLYQQLRGRDEYRHRIARMDLTYPPGTRTVYSDFGVILLGLIIEQVTGEPLDVFLQRELFEPLGMRDTGFNPLSWPYAQLELGGAGASAGMPPFVLNRIAPTEVDTLFRDRQLHGRVHDENAAAIGGVAGHAGLFSSARDLAVFAQLMLDHGYYGGRRLLDPETVATFTRRARPESSRAIGWDTPGGDASSAGEYFSARSYGHTGFTGTSIWIDPERDLFLILLTNRVNPTRANQKHVPLRRAVADAVQQAVRDVEVNPREPFEFSTR